MPYTGLGPQDGSRSEPRVVCTTRALRPGIARHHPTPAVTAGRTRQYKMAPRELYETVPPNSKTLESGGKSSGEVRENRWGLVETVGSQHDVVPGVEARRRAPTERRASTAVMSSSPVCALHRDAHFFDAHISFFPKLARVRARSVAMVQTGSRIGADEICRSMTNRVSPYAKLRSTAARAGSKGRPWTQDGAE